MLATPTPTLSNPGAFPSAPKKWSKEEDAQLSTAINKYGPRCWKSVADMVPGRSHAQCLQRWAKVLKPGLKKGQWTNEEDMHLTTLVQAGWKNWSVIAGEIHGRTSKQCRERWFHHLDPSINRSPYTEDEDKLILELQREIGGKWAKIARALDARTGEAVKIRFKTLDRHRKSGSTSRCPQVTRRRSFIYAADDTASPPITLRRQPHASPKPSTASRKRKGDFMSALNEVLGGRSDDGDTDAADVSPRAVQNLVLQPENRMANNSKRIKTEKARPKASLGQREELDWLANMLEEIDRESNLEFDDMKWSGLDDDVSVDELLSLKDEPIVQVSLAEPLLKLEGHGQQQAKKIRKCDVCCPPVR